MGFETGATVDAYRIAGTLGSGGMGEVYRVEHTLTKRQEAMKVLAGGRVRAGAEGQRFLREIQLQASLSHPNIAAVHHAFWLNDDLVMVMELVEGATLRSLMEVERISLQSGLNFARQVLDALDYAHQHGVIHRDVTPSNILITPGGVVKLTDFGLAKRPSDLHLTQSGAILGSLYYISPEQVRGGPLVDTRTDIYSMGVVLYEMAAGRRPFDADNPFSLMLAHVQQEPEDPRRIEPELPAALAETILTAMAKQPEARFATAGAFRQALERVQGSQAAAMPAGRASHWPRGRVMRYGAAMALVGVALFTSGARRENPSEEAAPAVPVDTRPNEAAPKPPAPGPKTAAPRKAEPAKKPENPEAAGNRPRRRFWLWRAMGKVLHPRKPTPSEREP